MRPAPNQLLAAIGAVAAAGAWAWSGTPAGAMLWVLALFAGCAGYGDRLARWLGERPSVGEAAVTGLACLIVASTVLARLGLLGRGVEAAAVVVGIAAGAIGRADRAQPMPRWLVGLVAVASLMLVTTQLARLSPWLTDGVDHTMEVARLWDTGRLGALPHQLGGLVVGESYLALAGGAGAAGAFDPGLCAALVVLVLAGELAVRDDSLAKSVFLVLVVPIVLDPEPTLSAVARWSGALFHLTACFALQRAMRERRVGWWVVPSALGLIALRWEFCVIALPYLAAGLFATRGPIGSRGALAAVIAIWLGALTLLASSPLLGLVRAIGATVVAVVATRAVLPLLGTYAWRSALGVLTFAVLAASLAALLVVPASAHSGSAISTTWFAAAAGVFALVDGRRLGLAGEPLDGERVRLPTWVTALVIFVGMRVLAPNFHQQQRGRVRARLIDAISDLRLASVNGYDTEQDRAVAGLQRRVPAGASIGLWGVSAAALDYHRNPIVDLDWRGERPLAQLSPPDLRGVAYVIIEDIEPPKPPPPAKRHPDLWGRGPLSLTSNVEQVIEPIASAGSTRLYRLVPGAPLVPLPRVAAPGAADAEAEAGRSDVRDSE